MPNKDKICILSQPACGDLILADVAKQYFIERRNIDITGGQPAQFNHGIGWRQDDVSTQNTLQDFLNVIANPYYVVKYYYYSPAILPIVDLQTFADSEDMTVTRLTRNNIVEHCIDFLAQEVYLWNDVDYSELDTQAEVDAFNIEAQNLIIDDTQLARFKQMRDDTDTVMAAVEATGIVDFTRDYDQIPWDNPQLIMNFLFPDPNGIPLDAVPIRKTPLTSATQTIIDTNNDLTNRINLLFV